VNWPWKRNRDDEMVIEELRADIESMRQRMEEEKKDEKPAPPALVERVADLEVKMSKLWGLVVETNPQTGKDRLNKHGRHLLGGKAALFGRNQTG